MLSDNLEARLDDIFREQADLYQSTGQHLSDAFQVAMAAALAVLMDQLRRSLALDEKGRIRRNHENLVILRRLPRLLAQLLRQHGLNKAIRAYVNEFPEQLPILSEVFQAQAESIGQKSLVRGALITKTDLAVLHEQQTVAVASLDAIVAATTAKLLQTVLQGVGRFSLPEAQVAISRTLDRSGKDLLVTGEAAMANFYRLANGQVFDRMQAVQSRPLLFRTVGPLDILNRPFCRRLEIASRAGQTWTRRQIGDMNNGMNPPWNAVWSCNGGINCRHSWAVSLDQ